MYQKEKGKKRHQITPQLWNDGWHPLKMVYVSEVGEMYNILNVQNQKFIKNSYFLHTYLGCIKVTSVLNQIYKNKKQEHAWLNLKLNNFKRQIQIHHFQMVTLITFVSDSSVHQVNFRSFVSNGNQ